MIAIRPVSVPKGAFVFCRYSLAVLLWVAFGLRHARPALAVGLLVVATGIMALSAVLTVKWAPLVALYSYTIDLIFPSPKEVLDINAMRFAHSLGTVLVGISLMLIAAGGPGPGWTFLFWVAIAKTIGALGFCAASKMYGCVNRGGTCYGFLRGGISDCSLDSHKAAP